VAKLLYSSVVLCLEEKRLLLVARDRERGHAELSESRVRWVRCRCILDSLACASVGDGEMVHGGHGSWFLDVFRGLTEMEWLGDGGM